MSSEQAQSEKTKTVAVFGGGCFWCTEAVFAMLKGVSSVLPGYSGGEVENPTYELVSGGKSGHVEVTKVEYDPRQISFEELLTVFFATHDPTTLNRQGNDVGPEYRSVIFYTTPEQKETAARYIETLQAEPGRPIVTAVEPFTKFYPAEDYHRNYYAKNSQQPYCQIIINPKVQKVREKFATLLKEKSS